MASLLLAGTVFGGEPWLYCTAAKKDVKTCCCELRGGKSICKLTGETFDKYCCISKTTIKNG